METYRGIEGRKGNEKEQDGRKDQGRKGRPLVHISGSVTARSVGKFQLFPAAFLIHDAAG